MIVDLQPTISRLVAVSIIALQPPRESRVGLASSTTIDSKDVHPLKIDPPEQTLSEIDTSITISLNDAGKKIERKFRQFLKQHEFIVLTHEPILMDSNLVQLANASFHNSVTGM